MKKKITATIIILCMLITALAATTLTALAATPSGWQIIAPDSSRFGFTDGSLASATVADKEGWMNSYALQTRAISAEDSYEVSATFTPTGGRNTQGVERQYGIVPWYINGDNYLQYFIFQKNDGVFAGYLYGKVNGAWRTYYEADDKTDATTAEWKDYWWDGGSMPENIRGKKDSLLTETITLKAVVSNVTHTASALACKKIEIHTIGTKVVDGEKAVDDKVMNFYVKDTTTQSPKIGVYVNKFDMKIDYSSYSSADITACEALISAIPNDEGVPSVESAEFAAAFTAANNAYLALKTNQSNLNETAKSLMTASISALAAKADAMIEAIDLGADTAITSITEARNFYNSLPTNVKTIVTKLTMLESLEESLESVVNVTSLINAIPVSVTIANKTAVFAARVAYDSLEDRYKANFPATVLAKLTAAEAAIAASEAKVAEAEALISAIYVPVTEADAAAIELARVEYNKLSTEEKNIVASYSVLVAAEKAYNEIMLAKADIPSGWKLQTNHTNISKFVFANGNISEINAIGGNATNQNNFAIKDTQLLANTDYSVAATFNPLEGNVTGSERTYALAPWYVDENNYLLFWMSQKGDKAFSGNFVGKVNGESRQFVMADNASSWNSAPYFDLWWDNSSYMPSGILRKQDALLTETVTLKAIVSNVTHTGLNVPCKKFELHIIAKNAAGTSVEDKLVATFYVKDTAAQAVRSAVYADNFNIGISSFLTANQVELNEITDYITAVPENTAADYFEKLATLYTAYNSLGDRSILLSNADRIGYADAMLALSTFMNAKINAINSAASTFKTDVLAIRAILSAMPSGMSDGIGEIAKFIAYEEAIADNAILDSVIEKINAIPSNVTIVDEAKVIAARTAYDSLNATLKAKITVAQLSKISSAEDTIVNLKAVNAVIVLINEIPTSVTISNKEKVVAARTAYNALTAAQKELITIALVKKINDAEADIEKLENPPKVEENSGCGSIAQASHLGFLILGLLLLAIITIRLKRKSNTK